jgi:hypothetical protein
MRNKAFQLIRGVLMEKRKEFIMIFSTYIIFYMFLTGMVQYVNYDLSYAISYFPYVSLSNLGIAIALSNHWLVVIYYSNLIVMITTGFLITLNILLLIYSRKNTHPKINKKEKITSTNNSWLIPAILIHVTCCGGALILVLINVAGTAIISTISFLIQYNFQISLIFIVILLLTNYLTLRRLLLKKWKKLN